MKLRVRHEDTQATVEVLKEDCPRYLPKYEQAAVLAWAAERGLEKAAWTYPTGNVDVKSCSECSEPVRGEICDWCFRIRDLTSRPDTGVLSSEELEYRAQLAERMSLRLATLSIELQAQAQVAASDPIEIVEIPRPPKVVEVFEKHLRDMLVEFEMSAAKFEMSAATGAALDRMAEVVGINRSNFGGFEESDASLRQRVLAVYRPDRPELILNQRDAMGLRVGDMIQLSNSNGQLMEARITQIEHADGVANIRYEATLSNPIQSVNISFNVP